MMEHCKTLVRWRKSLIKFDAICPPHKRRLLPVRLPAMRMPEFRYFSVSYFSLQREERREQRACVCVSDLELPTHTPNRFRFVTNFPTIWAILSPTFLFQIETDVIFRHLTLQILHVHVFFAKICCSIEAFHHHQSKNIQREIHS